MSGICGIINFDGAPVDPELLKRMAETAAYRGPDGINYWVDDNVGLAHLALHTTSEALRERQPLINHRGDLVLVADARVDNRDDLIRTLIAKGYFHDEVPTDADIILAAYQCWGEACPLYLIGDFVFAIWDDPEQRLFCGRDALGLKPLHYSWVGDVFCFSSEAGQILQHPAIPRQLDEVTMAYHLATNFFDGERTIFRGICRLPPAHFLIASQTQVQVERYWDIDPGFRITYRQNDDYAAHFLEVFSRAVVDRLRTQADAIGISMSGGLDSCSVAAVAQKILSARSGSSKLVAYSNVYDRLVDCDERAYSSAMATELGIEIEHVNAEDFWLLSDPQAFRPSLETPFMVWEEGTGRHMLGRLQERGGKIILSGLGGDNVLQGSQFVHLDRLLRGQVSVLVELTQQAQEEGISYFKTVYMHLLRPLLPDRVLRFSRRLLRRDNLSQFPLIPPWLALDFVDRTDLANRLAAYPGVPKRFLSRARQESYEQSVALGTVGLGVSWFDRVAAHFGVEGRHPFLDRRLVEFLLAIPPEQVFWGTGPRKLILRRAMRNILPEIIRQRKDKTRFTSFIDHSLQEQAVDQINELFDAPLLGKIALVDSDELRRAYDAYRTGKTRDPSRRLWFTITLELWLRSHYTF